MLRRFDGAGQAAGCRIARKWRGRDKMALASPHAD